MEAARKTEIGSPNQCAGNVGRESAGIVSEPQEKTVCPECGSANLVFGSRDPCEGDWYWCEDCGNGPILFPLHYTRKFIQPVIDAEESNRALKLAAMLREPCAAVIGRDRRES